MRVSKKGWMEMVHTMSDNEMDRKIAMIRNLAVRIERYTEQIQMARKARGDFPSLSEMYKKHESENLSNLIDRTGCLADLVNGIHIDFAEDGA